MDNFCGMEVVMPFPRSAMRHRLTIQMANEQPEVMLHLLVHLLPEADILNQILGSGIVVCHERYRPPCLHSGQGGRQT